MTNPIMSESNKTNPQSIVSDLTWIDLLKGLAIIGVFMDNWTIYFNIHFTLWGPWVQVFFILSGFGLSLTYLNRQANWQWTRWAWRRITKIMVRYILAVFFSFVLGIVGIFIAGAIFVDVVANLFNLDPKFLPAGMVLESAAVVYACHRGAIPLFPSLDLAGK